jgi:hypothetical protein
MTCLMKMNMKTKIDKIWEDLEKKGPTTNGLVFRRYSPEILPDVYIAVDYPSKNRCLFINLKKTKSVNISSFSELRDIKIGVVDFNSGVLINLLIIELNNPQHKDIFSVLCEDLIGSIMNVSNEKTLVKGLLNQFEKWKSLFESAGSQGLSPEGQRGLFGELYFLRKILSGKDLFSIINSWTGPEKQIHDFQIGNCSVEVKTTHGNNHQRIQISSERQLDASHIENLFLFHLSLDSRHLDGETLNQMVDSVSMLLDSDSSALNKFNSKLLAAGYFNHHRELYNDTGYLIRQENYYKVEHDFPRIEELDVRQGVGDVKYSIIVSGCKDYLISENLATEKLLNHA